MDEALMKRVLPHSVEAEQSVIGSMLDGSGKPSSPRRRSSQAPIFTSTSTASCLSRWSSFSMRESPVDLVTLQNRLREKDVPPEVSSLDFVRDIMTSVPTSANVRSYANIVYGKRQSCDRSIKVNEEIANTLLRR